MLSKTFYPSVEIKIREMVLHDKLLVLQLKNAMQNKNLGRNIRAGYSGLASESLTRQWTVALRTKIRVQHPGLALGTGTRDGHSG